jgi:hypothetical protein
VAGNERNIENKTLEKNDGQIATDNIQVSGFHVRANLLIVVPIACSMTKATLCKLDKCLLFTTKIPGQWFLQLLFPHRTAAERDEAGLGPGAGVQQVPPGGRLHSRVRSGLQEEARECKGIFTVVVLFNNRSCHPCILTWTIINSVC